MRFFTHLLIFLSAMTLYAEKVEIIPRSDWQALEARPYAPQQPERFTIHHSAVAFDKSQDAATHIRNIQSWGMGEAREWADIPYHFIISPRGEIFEGRDPAVQGESNTAYDTDGHLQINCLGNFQEQEPTPEQIDALVRLIAWASEEFQIPTSTISAHRDHASTLCPGANLYGMVESGELREKADAILKEAPDTPGGRD